MELHVDSLASRLRGEFEAAHRAVGGMLTERVCEAVASMTRAIVGSLRDGGKVMACGNGGSSADAMHFCEELTGRYRGDRPALAAIACTDVGHVTCVSNDYGYEHVFSRWVEALGQSGDVLVLLSTSGTSRNIVRASEAGRERGMTRIALLGRDGGTMRGLCEHELVVAGDASDRIQELHMLCLHAMVSGIEQELGLA